MSTTSTQKVQKLPSKHVEPKSELMTVTPDMAWKWLDMNIKNRPMVDLTIQRYTNQILMDKWEVNGESIKFNTDGRLIDGQHRLSAIRQAGKPIKIFVTTGLDPKTFHTLDTGRERKPSDVMYIRGEINVNVLTAALRLVYLYDHFNGDFGRGNGLKGLITVSDLEATLDKHPDLRKSVNTLAASPLKKMSALSVVTALHYLFSKVSVTSANVFFDKLAMGDGLDKTSPILVLRNHLLYRDQDRNRGYETQMQRIACMIIAWNAHIKGQALTAINWQKGSEFPKIERKIKAA